MTARDPYEVEAWLNTLPSEERDHAERAALAARGLPTLSQWKDLHAYGIALKQTEDEMRRGPCAYYIYIVDDDPEGVTILQEELPPPNLAKLAKAAGLSKEEVAEMAEDELREAVTMEIGEALLGERSDGYYKLAEAPTLFELVQRLLEQDLMEPDLGGEDRPSDRLFSDEALDRNPGPYGKDLKEIQSLRLRRIASGLREGVPAGAVEMVNKLADASYTRNILLRRPGWEFVCAWEAQAPVHDTASCILRKKAGKGGGSKKRR